jgi:4-hydroxy-3-methylbut-2-enyl diphosphate reductase
VIDWRGRYRPRHSRWGIGATTVGLTAGASAPADRVADVLSWLVTRGYDEVVEVEIARETQQFALPAALRAA